MKGFAIFCLLLHLVVSFYLPNRLLASNVNHSSENSSFELPLPTTLVHVNEKQSHNTPESKNVDQNIEPTNQATNIGKQILSVTEVNNSTSEEGGAGSLVNHFTGDLNYSIPLFEIDGYPMKLSYTSGATMEQEASWVGLGWNLAPGAINRSIRGLPDDFKGDKIVHSRYMKPNRTITLSTSIPFKSKEFFGFPFPAGRFNVGLNYNNYSGLYSSLGFAASYQRSNSKSDASFGLSLNSSQRDGVTVSPSFSMTKKFSDLEKMGQINGGLSLDLNSRGGLLSVKPILSAAGNFIVPADKPGEFEIKPFNYSFGGSIAFNNAYQSPPDINMDNLTLFGSSKFSKYIGPESREILTLGVNYKQSTISDEDKNKERPAYGYINLDSVYSGTTGTKINILDEAILDFAKDKDQGLSNYLPNLSMPFVTFDNFSLSTQTFSSSFRAYKPNISVVFDPKAISGPKTPLNLSPELGIGNQLKVSFSGNFGYSKTYIGPFKNEQDREVLISQILGYQAVESLNNEVVFKDEGGFSTIERLNEGYYKFYGKMNPSAFILSREVDDSYSLATPNIVQNNSTNSLLLNTLATLALNDVNNEIPVQSAIGKESIFKFDEYGTSITPLSRKNCLEIVDWVKSINHIERNYQQIISVQTISRSQAEDIPNHHIYAFEAKSSNGMIFRFGVPQITWFNEEFSASVEAEPKDYKGKPYFNSSFPINVGQASRSSNKGGQNKYFSYKRVPAHIENYLLSSVLSPDYVDRSLNGPTDDDAGTFVRFKYFLKHRHFGYRTPNHIDFKSTLPDQPKTETQFVLNHSANIENLNRSNSDDIASFSYSEKELWYISEIAGRSSVAIFELEEDESKKSINIDGSVSSSKNASRLKSISVYDRYYDKLSGKYLKVNNPKLTIYFTYYEPNYSLCGYKLSLKELVFKEYQSSKGQSRKYEFKYSQFIDKKGIPYELISNYSRFNQDRWGAPVFVYNSNTSSSLRGLNSAITEKNMPYEFPQVLNSLIGVDDGPTLNGNPSLNYYNSVDIKSNVWNLTEITTPTNTRIQIQYERDSYSMVEQERVGELYKFIKFYRNKECTQELENLIGSNNLGDIIWAKLVIPKDVPVLGNEEIVKKNLLTRFDGSIIEQVYFRAWIKLRRDFASELITGYANIDNSGDGALNNSLIISETNEGLQNHFISIPINSELLFKNSIGDRITPFAKASFNRMKNDLRFIFNNHIADPDASLDDIVPFLFGSIKEVFNSVVGFNTMCKTLQLANELDETKNSYIRLGSALNFKYGGNQRVKYVKYISNLDIYGGSTDERNGITVSYNYSLDQTGKTSGVATSEPMLGQDDNLRKYPLAYEKELILAPDLSFSQELPYGESLLPSPSIGYSLVSVTEKSNLATAGDNKYKLGSEVYTFYTAKDFPSLVSITPLQKSSKNQKSPPIPFYSYNLNSYGCSQGFAIELNNMHGKPRSKRIYSGFVGTSNTINSLTASPISGVDYYYNIINGRVSNQVSYVDKQLKISSSIPDFTSCEYDWVVYNREESSISNQFELNMNLEVLLIGTFPMPFPIPISFVARSEDKFKYIAFTKQRSVYGMLDSTVTFDLSNYVVSKVEAYDKHTGEPVVSSVTNSFKDKQYAVNIPAYWVYSSLGKSNIDAGKVFVDVYDKNIPNGSTLKLAGNSSFPTILKSGNKFSFIQGDGRSTSIRAARAVRAMIDDPTTNGSIEEFLKNKRVLSISSGNKNMLTVPAQTANFIRNPLTDNNGKLLERLNLSGSVLDAKAFVFDKYQCENVDGVNKMAYLESYFKPTASYYYKSDRVQSRVNQNVNLRTDGVYTSFTPFWNLTGNKIVKNRNNWVLVDTILTIDEFGFPLETVDKTGRIITRIPGNSASVLRLEAFNANTNDLFFEDFEMNSKNDENALDFKANGEKDKIKDVLSHSGNKAYEVGRNSNFRLYVPLVPDECKEYDCEPPKGGGGSTCCDCPKLYIDSRTQELFFVFSNCPESARSAVSVTIVYRDGSGQNSTITSALEKVGNTNHYKLVITAPVFSIKDLVSIDCNASKCTVNPENDPGNGNQVGISIEY